MAAAKRALGWDPDKQFYVPDEALAHWRRCVERGDELVADWKLRFDAYAEAHPDLAEDFNRLVRRDVETFEKTCAAVDPEAFEPDRWSGDLAKQLPRFAFFPFGGGPRVCIGNAFAMMEAVLLLVTIARKAR